METYYHNLIRSFNFLQEVTGKSLQLRFSKIDKAFTYPQLIIEGDNAPLNGFHYRSSIEYRKINPINEVDLIQYVGNFDFDSEVINADCKENIEKATGKKDTKWIVF